jgi:hypothetical protein
MLLTTYRIVTGHSQSGQGRSMNVGRALLTGGAAVETNTLAAICESDKSTCFFWMLAIVSNRAAAGSRAPMPCDGALVMNPENWLFREDHTVDRAEICMYNLFFLSSRHLNLVPTTQALVTVADSFCSKMLTPTGPRFVFMLCCTTAVSFAVSYPFGAR